MAGPYLLDRCRETSTTTGTGTLTLAGAATGYRTLAAVGDGNTCYYSIGHQSAAEWETGIGTYTSSGTTLSRTTILSSSNSGSAVSFSSGTKDVMIAPIASHGLPGQFAEGRLTLTTGTPVTSTDVTAADTIYYTPYTGNRITLPAGDGEVVVEFAEVSLSLSGYTVDKNYDIWGYLSSGTVALDSTIWTNDTTRATALTTHKGRYVKTGATSRLYLGTIRISSVTGEGEDSIGKRFVWNMYNRQARALVWRYTSNYSESNGSWHVFNSSNANRISWVTGLAVDGIDALIGGAFVASGTTGYINMGLDSTGSTQDTAYNVQGTGTIAGTAPYTYSPQIGAHYISPLVVSSGSVTFYGSELRASYRG